MHSIGDGPPFFLILDLEVPWAHTWADMRKGKTDLERREIYRKHALGRLEPVTTGVQWWAFEIFVCKSGRMLDIDNVPKPIIDSFCERQIIKDGSDHVELGLFPDDSLQWVRAVNVHGEPAEDDSTRIKIFAYAPGTEHGDGISICQR